MQKVFSQNGMERFIELLEQVKEPIDAFYIKNKDKREERYDEDYAFDLKHRLATLNNLIPKLRDMKYTQLGTHSEFFYFQNRFLEGYVDEKVDSFTVALMNSGMLLRTISDLHEVLRGSSLYDLFEN